MTLYKTIMRGFKDNTLNYNERYFLMELARQVSRLTSPFFETEIQECSRPGDYGLLPKFEPFIVRMLERGCAQYLVLCNELLDTDDFTAIRKKYRLTMPKMTGEIAYPYLCFSWGYLEAERTPNGLKFTGAYGENESNIARWREQDFKRLQNRKTSMSHRDPMFPWRLYDYIRLVRTHIHKKLIPMTVVKFDGTTVETRKVDGLSNLTKHAAVKMLLCAVNILDNYRHRTLAGEFTSKDTTFYLNRAWMSELREIKWTGDKKKYCG